MISLEINIYFKCERCGHNRIVHIKVNVAVSSRVYSMVRHPFHPSSPDLVPILSGYDHIGGRYAGFACEKCRHVFADNDEKLYRYLRERKMIGKYAKIED